MRFDLVRPSLRRCSGRSFLDNRIYLWPCLASAESQGATADFRGRDPADAWRRRIRFGLLLCGGGADRRLCGELGHHLADEFIIGPQVPQPFAVMTDQLGPPVRSPCRWRCPRFLASRKSVLSPRSGLCFLGQTSTMSTLPSRMFFTGIQYDPVLSIATLVQPSLFDSVR